MIGVFMVFTSNHAQNMKVILLGAAGQGEVRVEIPQSEIEPVSYYEPTTRTYQDGEVFDFVLVEQEQDDIYKLTGHNSSVHLIGLQLPWPWKQFTCQYRGAKSTTHGLFVDTWGTHAITVCPIPPFLPRNNGIYLSLVDADAVPLHPHLVDIYVPAVKKVHHNVCVYTMVKDRCAQLQEWIEYHRLIGFEHFYIYDNNSTDCTRSILKRYQQQGLVTLVHWPFTAKAGTHWNSIQAASMRHALKVWGTANDWMGYFDVDEFLQINPKAVGTSSVRISDVLSAKFPLNQVVRAIVVEMWLAQCNPDETLVLDRRHKLLFQMCRGIKTGGHSKMILRPREVPNIQNIHVLEPPLTYVSVNWETFGRFRHYHYMERTRGNDDSMDCYIPTLLHAMQLPHPQYLQ